MAEPSGHDGPCLLLALPEEVCLPLSRVQRLMLPQRRSSGP